MKLKRRYCNMSAELNVLREWTPISCSKEMLKESREKYGKDYAFWNNSKSKYIKSKWKSLSKDLF
jgi:hypothetical protein